MSVLFPETQPRVTAGSSFDSGVEAFERSAAAAGLALRHLSVAGLSIRLAFAGEALTSVLMPALRHLETTDLRPAHLTVSIWDDASTGTKFLATVRDKRSSLRSEATLFNPRHIHIDGGRTVLFQPADAVLNALDSKVNRGLFWTDDAAELPYWEMGAPLRAVFSWWFKGRSHRLVHAGAVGDERGGLLLVGRGGSGKSTTTLSCLDWGMQFAGDDYVLVETSERPFVRSIYGSAKVDLGTLELLPQFKDFVINLHNLPAEKGLLFPSVSHPQLMAEGWPLKGVVIPKIDVSRSSPAIHEVSRARALAALAPSTIFQMPGSGEQDLRALAGILANVPAYELRLGRDLRDVPGLVSNLLDIEV